MFVDKSGFMPEWLPILFKCLAGIAIIAICVASAGFVPAAIGVGVSLTGTFVGDLIDDGQINSGWETYLGAAVGGAISALGSGFISTLLSSGLGNSVEGLFNGSINNFGDFMKQFALGALIGGVTYGASIGLSKFRAASKLDNIVGNWNTSNTKINKKLLKAGFGYLKAGRDSYKKIFDEFYKKKGYKLIGQIASHTYDFILGILL